MSTRTRRLKSETICDSLFMTVGVVVPVVVSLYLYRNDPKKLFRILFALFLVLVAFIMTRNVWVRLAGNLVGLFGKSKKIEKKDSTQSHDRSSERKEAVSKAQERHDEKAEDYDRRIAGPRREQKLRELEDKMRSIRGLKDEGVSLGGSAVSSRLLHDNHMTGPTESPDNHMTGTDSDVSEEEGEGWVTISLRLPDRSARRKFRVTQKVQSLYAWLKSLGYHCDDYFLTTLVPKSPLDDRKKTLFEVGLTRDTTLVAEEKDD